MRFGASGSINWSNYSRMELKRDHRTVKLIQGDREQSVWRKDQPEYLVHSYTQLVALAMLTWSGYKPRRRGRALIVGLGGGILCRFIRKNFPNVSIEVTEPDARVIEIARQYFDLSPAVGVHCIDGRSHIFGRTGKYDLIVLDAFDSTYVPAELMTAEFLEQVRRRLNPDGVFISNTWVLRDITPHEDKTYTSIFGQIWDFRRRPNTDGNRIILVNHAMAQSVAEVVAYLATAAEKVDEISDYARYARIPGARRMLSYADMVGKLHVMQVLAPMAGRILTDANINAIRSKASFENEE